MKRDDFQMTHAEIQSALAPSNNKPFKISFASPEYVEMDAQENSKGEPSELEEIGESTVFSSAVWDGKDSILQETPDSLDSMMDSDFEETLLAPTPLDPSFTEKNLFETSGIRRGTVLPKAVLNGKAPELKMLAQDRYEQVKFLGEGASGDVLLAKDNDIKRLVALKKLKTKHHIPSTLSRFVEEIQTVGHLEHPNIVPIHDVGIDENGQYYFVMKYVEGQTMEDLIEKMMDGDKETLAAYPFEVRNQIFLKILQAVNFAHLQGIIHRDIKPANIMIGQHGEVMVMDWGLAKEVISLSGSPEEKAKLEKLLAQTSKKKKNFPETKERLFQTQLGTIMGTPAYMAPEQAVGANQTIDQRSDIYSLSVLYYEWMGLRHYLSHKCSMEEMLWGILQEQSTELAFLNHPHQDNVPAEFSHFCANGMAKPPEDRYQSTEEMLASFQLALSGKFDVVCPITFVKRGGNDTLHYIDKYPVAMITAACVAGGVFLYGSATILFQLGSLFFG